MLASYPKHQISDQILLQYFYEELALRKRNIIDATSCETFINETPTEAQTLIATIATNSKKKW